MTLAESTTGLWDVPNNVYFSDTDYISHSSLEIFRQSPVEYAARFVYGTMQHPAPTPQMILGTALHIQILEPERWDELVAIVPDCDRRTKEGKAQWKTFCDNRNGRILLEEEDNKSVVAMAKSACAHPEVQELMRHAWKKEQPVRCLDSNGIPRKSKIDIICTGPLIVDFKTACDPSPDGFARAAANLGYHRQAAFYVDVAGIVFGKKYKFVHVVVQNCEPWECAAYWLDERDIQLGREQNERDLLRIRECYKSDEWRGPQNTGIMKLKLPKWASYVE